MWGTAVCLGQPGPPFFSRILGEVEKCSGACLHLRAHPDLEEDVQGTDPAGTRSRLTLLRPRSAGRAWVPHTLPAEANQFCWQVEAGVGLGAVSRSTLVLGKAGRLWLLPCPRVHARLGVQQSEQDPSDNSPIHPRAARAVGGSRLFRPYHLRSSSAG